MDKLFDKLGLYDFWGTFVPGFIGMTVFLNVLGYLQGKASITVHLDYNLLLFVVYSYLLGLFLHELGHLLQNNIIYRKVPFPIINLPRNCGEPFDTFLDKLDCSFSAEEKSVYGKFFRKWKDENQVVIEDNHASARLFFNYCDYVIEQKGKNTKAAKMQSLYGMSRSLFVFFGLLSIAIFPYSVYISSDVCVWNIELLSVISTILFYVRMKRFNVIRLKVVLRTFFVSK